jgi:hypothetical protein
VTASRLRRDAADAGYPVTYAQFDSYRVAGLLPEPDASGRYPAWALGALLAVRRLSREVRALSRRVIRLGSDAVTFPVPPEKLRAAMLELVTIMTDRTRKMARVARAASRGRPIRAPKVSTWKALVEAVPAEHIALWAPGWYAMVRDVIPTWSAPGPDPLADIAFEEQVTLYALLDLHQRSAR